MRIVNLIECFKTALRSIRDEIILLKWVLAHINLQILVSFLKYDNPIKVRKLLHLTFLRSFSQESTLSFCFVC